MIMDFRYHLFTITAVFAALGLGILIGTSIIGNEGLIKEQQKIINNIAKDINYLQTKNSTLTQDIKKLKEELNYRQERERKFLSLLMEEKMQGRKYVIYTGGQEISSNIRKIFNLAGAELKLIRNDKQIKNEEEINKIIFWRVDKKGRELYKKTEADFKNKTFLFEDQNLIGLILTLMENKLNEN